MIRRSLALPGGKTITIAILAKLLHVLVAFALVTGVVGRNLAFMRARNATTTDSVFALSQLSEYFERRLVIPVSALVLIFGLATAWL